MMNARYKIVDIFMRIVYANEEDKRAKFSTNSNNDDHAAVVIISWKAPSPNVGMLMEPL